MTKTTMNTYRIYRFSVTEGEELNEFIGDKFNSIADAVEAVEDYVKSLNSMGDGRNTVITRRNLDRHDRRWLCRIHQELYGFTPERESESAIELETSFFEEGEEMCITSYVEIFSANW